MAAKPAMHAARLVQRSRPADGDRPSPTFRFLFLFIFNRFKSRESESSAPQCYPRIGNMQTPPKSRSPGFHIAQRDLPFHHRGRPNFLLSHLRTRTQDPPVCVTKSLAIPATPSRNGAYLRTRNTLDSRVLRHNSPSPGPPPSRRRLCHFQPAPQLDAVSPHPGTDPTCPRGTKGAPWDRQVSPLRAGLSRAVVLH